MCIEWLGAYLHQGNLLSVPAFLFLFFLLVSGLEINRKTSVETFCLLFFHPCELFTFSLSIEFFFFSQSDTLGKQTVYSNTFLADLIFSDGDFFFTWQKMIKKKMKTGNEF